MKIGNGTRRFAINKKTSGMLIAIALVISAQAGVEITSLDELGGGNYFASCVNNQRQIVGASYQTPLPGTAPRRYAVLWVPGDCILNLGTLGGCTGWAHSINDHGIIVGEDTTMDGMRLGFRINPIRDGVTGQAIRWYEGVPQPSAYEPSRNYLMQPLTFSAKQTEALDVNEAGAVVGAYYDGPGLSSRRGILWLQDNTPVDLLIPLDPADNVSINNAGWIVAGGYLILPRDINGDRSPDLWCLDENNDNINDLAQPLPGTGVAINDSGVVLVRSPGTPLSSRDFLWANGKVIATLKVPGARVPGGWGLNGANQVVGGLDQEQQAFLWSERGGLIELPKHEGPSAACAITEDGTLIAGMASDANGSPKAIVWTLNPDTETGNSVTVAPSQEVKLTFAEVKKAGATVAKASAEAPGPNPPGHKTIGDYVEISTTAEFEGPVAVSLSYDPALARDESRLKLFHLKSEGEWVDVTEAVDTTDHKVVGKVDSFSWFVVAEPSDLVPPVVSLLACPSVSPAGQGFVIRALANDSTSGASRITQAACSLDGGNTWVNMAPVDGFDSAVELIELSVPALQAGIYSVVIKATDASGNTGASATTLLPIFDAAAGFVTGGGWINSPAGAYLADPQLTGKATFGFVAKYQKGANVPTGNTEFQFKAGNLHFKSTSYQWLVVAGARAQFKGWGTINGSGNYAFMLTAVDGQVSGGGGADRLRIKIWDETSGTTVYDNQSGAGDTADLTGNGTLQQGGSIVIQKGP